jgi:hypothetical protein
VSLLAYYKLDEDVLDYGPNEYDGTNSGVSFATGQVNNAGDFEESESDYISIGNISGLNFSGSTSLSISFWIKMESSVADMSILSKRNHVSPFEGWEVFITSTNKIRFSIGSNNTTDKLEVESTNTITDSTWTHVIITYNGSQLPSGVNIYINNTVESSLTTIQNNFTGDSSNSYNASIGSRNNTTTFFDGLLDEVRIYNSVLTPSEREDIYNFNGIAELIINGIDYSLLLSEYSANLIFGQAKQFEFNIIDEDYSVRNVIKYQDTFVFREGGVDTWNGVLINKPIADESGILTILANGKEIFLISRFISVSYIAKTIDFMVKDIIDTYFSSLFTYNNVGTYTNTYDVVYSGQSAWFILQKLMELEDLQIFIDVDDDIHVTGLFDEDSGLSLDYDAGDDIFDPDFPDVGGTVQNAIIVHSAMKDSDGVGGVAVRYKNQDSISEYGEIIEHPPISDTTIFTKEECLAKAKSIIDEVAFELQHGTFSTDRSPLLFAGQTLLVSLASKNFVNKRFIIKNISHTLSPYFTIMDVAQIENSTNKILKSVLNALRQSEERFRDSTATISEFAEISEQVPIKVTLTVTRVLKGSRAWRGVPWRGFSWRGGTESEVITIEDEEMVLTNAGRAQIVDILLGNDTVNIFDSTHLFIGMGDGTTTELATDTTLESELDVKAGAGQRMVMEAGYPLAPTVYKIDSQGVITDTDVAIQTTYYEIGLFSADTGGIMYARKVVPTGMIKNVNEDLTSKIQLEVVESS